MRCLVCPLLLFDVLAEYELVMLRLASSIESLQNPTPVVEISFMVLSYLSDCLMDLHLGDLNVDPPPSPLVDIAEDITV